MTPSGSSTTTIVPLSRLQQPRDQLGRPMHDLRISVMDRCNFRCPYCMPKEKYHEKYQFMRTAERLSFEEIVRLVRLFVPLGVRKIRLTGGEPLLRANLPDLISDLNNVQGIEDVALTTNGVLLVPARGGAGGRRPQPGHRQPRQPRPRDLSQDEWRHGHRRRRARWASSTRGSAGLSPIKLNAVIQRGLNDHTALDLVERFRGTGVIVRFIEYMDVGNRNDWKPELVDAVEGAGRAHRRALAHRAAVWRTIAAKWPSAMASRTVRARSASSPR